MVIWIEGEGGGVKGSKVELDKKITYFPANSTLLYSPSIQIDPKRAQKEQNQQHTSAKENERHIN